MRRFVSASAGMSRSQWHLGFYRWLLVRVALDVFSALQCSDAEREQPACSSRAAPPPLLWPLSIAIGAKRPQDVSGPNLGELQQPSIAWAGVQRMRVFRGAPRRAVAQGTQLYACEACRPAACVFKLRCGVRPHWCAGLSGCVGRGRLAGVARPAQCAGRAKPASGVWPPHAVFACVCAVSYTHLTLPTILRV